jgi:hypothetical protein
MKKLNLLMLLGLVGSCVLGTNTHNYVVHSNIPADSILSRDRVNQLIQSYESTNEIYHSGLYTAFEEGAYSELLTKFKEAGFLIVDRISRHGNKHFCVSILKNSLCNKLLTIEATAEFHKAYTDPKLIYKMPILSRFTRKGLERLLPPVIREVTDKVAEQLVELTVEELVGKVVRKPSCFTPFEPTSADRCNHLAKKLHEAGFTVVLEPRLLSYSAGAVSLSSVNDEANKLVRLFIDARLMFPDSPFLADLSHRFQNGSKKNDLALIPLSVQEPQPLEEDLLRGVMLQARPQDKRLTVKLSLTKTKPVLEMYLTYLRHLKEHETRILARPIDSMPANEVVIDYKFPSLRLARIYASPQFHANYTDPSLLSPDPMIRLDSQDAVDTLIGRINTGEVKEFELQLSSDTDIEAYRSLLTRLKDEGGYKLVPHNTFLSEYNKDRVDVELRDTDEGREAILYASARLHERCTRVSM